MIAPARRLGLFDLTMLATGAAIGSGVFRTPSEIASHVPSPAWALAVWALGGAATIAGALTFAELGAMMPRAGGMYAYLSEAYGDLVGFLQGWAYLLVVATGAIAALALVFAEYVAFFVPLDAVEQRALALGALAVLAMVNIVGVRAAASMAGVMTALKLAALAALVLFGMLAPAASSTPWTGGGVPSSSAVAAALIGVLWSYGGWQHATFAAAEARRPARDVALGIVLATALVTLVYLAANWTYFHLLPFETIRASSKVASDAAVVAVGRGGASFVAGAVALSALGTVGVYTLTSPRVYWTMAERGLFFRGIGAIHPRFRTPARAIVLQTAWASVLVLFWGTFENLISYVLFVDWIFFGLTGAAVLILRRRLPNADRPYRVPFSPFVPLLFVGVAAWFVASTLWGQPRESLAGGGLLALGVPVFWAWDRRRQRKT
ncbi:MAG TPA: amino acid permease, partial [Polyangiaceae bacterium]